MILLYAVVPAAAGTDALGAETDALGDARAGVGAGGAGVGVAEGVSLLARDGVGVVYREVAAVPTADRSEVLHFGRVLTALADRTTVLPVRFGTVLSGVEQAEELLQTRGAAWRARLDDLADHVELIVHVGLETVAAPPAPAPANPTGGDYLRAKVSEHRRRSAEVEEVAAVVTPWCRAARALPPMREATEVRLACLVPADGVADLRAAVGSWAADHTGRHVTVTGPFPVFSFTEDDLA